MEKRNFNSKWMFFNEINDLSSDFAGAKQNGYMVDLPHDAMITAGRSSDSITGSGGGYFNAGNYEYVKSYYAPKSDEGKIIYLEFEGIYMNAAVEVNGEFVGKRTNGYTDFVLQIQDYLRFGQENQIKVLVKNNAQPNGRWYTGAGIYRGVHLMIAPEVHIAPDGIRVTTLAADKEIASLDVEIDVAHMGVGHKKQRLHTCIKNAENQIVAQSFTTFNLKSNQTLLVRQHIYLDNPALWNVDTPDLYTCECTIVEDEQEIDHAATNFGIRILQLDNVYGLRINGIATKLKGGCIHHDNGLIGAATFPDAEERRICLLKQAGYNAIRSAHNPISKALLDACDKHGMLVMDEYADCWTHTKNLYDYAFSLTEWWEQDIESMVRKDYNHPSVIMYSIGNEIPDVGQDISAGWGRLFAEKIRSLDHTRYVTNAVNVLLANMDKIGLLAGTAGENEVEAGEINTVMVSLADMMSQLTTHPIASAAIEESCELLDVIGYNYSADRYELDHEQNKNRIVLGSETSPVHLDYNWDLVLKHGYVLGDFAWTAWDYLGETGIGRTEPGPSQQELAAPYPWVAAYCGDFDITGFRRPVSYWREIIWNGRNHKPYIAVQNPKNIGKEMYVSIWSWTDSLNSWTWPGCEGVRTIVEVYSDAEEVELLLNDKSLGRKSVEDEFKKFYCKWQVPYEQGKLEAIAYINGEVVGRDLLQTAGESHLIIEKEKESLRSKSDELCYIAIEMRDAEGTLDMSENTMITVKLEGPAEILGCGSANPCTTENYTECSHELYQGRLLVVVRAGKEEGIAKLVVRSNTEEIAVELPIR